MVARKTAGKPKSKTTAGKAGKPRARSKAAAKPPVPVAPWGLWTLAAVLGVAALRLAVNALDLVPVHFDEAQYWAYGHELAAGHFSKPPLVGWIIYATTGLGGDSEFWLRTGAVAAHALVAGFAYMAARALFDGRTGFWAAVAYTLAPGVSASAMIMSTDPVMMAFWAVALWAWVRAAETGRPHWWVLLGLALGLGALAKYTALAFVAGALGYGLFSARGRDWRGLGIAAAACVLALSPNLIWLAANDFVTASHVAEDAAPPGSRYNPGKLAEFVGAQFGVIGPVWFAAMLAAFWFRREWIGDWRMRLLAWQTGALLFAMIALAFWTRAQPNWAAPAYVAGAIFAAHWLLSRGWRWALPVQAGTGAVAALALVVAAWAYAPAPSDLPRAYDPFKKMRLGEPFCARALAAMAEEGAELLLSNDRRRLSECMFLGGFGWQEIAVWNPDLAPSNHHELVSTLRPGEDRPALLAVMSADTAREIAARFDDAREIEAGQFATHADRAFGYSLWIVQGFRGYP